MPWKQIGPMDQKIQLISDWRRTSYNKTELSRKYDISRKTVYKWLDRYKEQGIDGLKDRSREPKHCPGLTPDHIVNLIIAEKLKNRKRGPKKIRSQLQRQHPNISWPAPSTIGEWLKKKGLVRKRKKRLHVPPYTEPFKDCEMQNAVWSADYKGQFYTGDGRVCYPLTISDNYSRYLIKCHGLPGPSHHETKGIFEDAFQEYGMPDAIRVDNGTPFTGKGIGGLSRLSIWWIKLGIVPERIDKGCPQQNGRHERMHRTLKEEALDPVAVSMRDQQERFDIFRQDYNYHRPHEALQQDSPCRYYEKSSRSYVENPVSPDYELDYAVRHVRHNGEIKFKGSMYYLTQLLTGEPIGLKQVSNDEWNIYYSFYKLGTLDLRSNRIVK